MTRIAIALFFLILALPGAARAQFGQSVGIFYIDMEIGEEQDNSCLDWTWVDDEFVTGWVPNETCLEEMSRTMDQHANLFGLNNLVYCWYDYGCRYPDFAGGGFSGCSGGCEGICFNGINLPNWIPGTGGNRHYFYSSFVDNTKAVMKAHNQWWDQQADWQDANPTRSRNPCFKILRGPGGANDVTETSTPVPGKYGQFGLTMSGWGKGMVLPETEGQWQFWKDLLGDAYSGFYSDPMFLDLANRLVFVHNGRNGASHALAIQQRLLVLTTGTMFLKGYLDGSWPDGSPPGGLPASPGTAATAPITNLDPDLWEVAAYATAIVQAREYAVGGDARAALGFPTGPYPDAFVDFFNRLQDQTCGYFGDCGVVPTVPSTWGGIKARYRED